MLAVIFVKHRWYQTYWRSWSYVYGQIFQLACYLCLQSNVMRAHAFDYLWMLLSQMHSKDFIKRTVLPKMKTCPVVLSHQNLHICFDFGLFLLVKCGWSVHILILIQTRSFSDIIDGGLCELFLEGTEPTFAFMHLRICIDLHLHCIPWEFSP